MPYVISNGYNKYIRQDAAGNFTPVTCAALADVWDQRNKANNILNNCVNKTIRKKFKVVEIDPTAGTARKSVTKLVNGTTTTIKPCGSEQQDGRIGELSGQLVGLKQYIQSAEDRRAELNESLSNVDKEITDIEHYVELSDKVNAYQGWLAYKLLRDKLRARRVIKDELQIMFKLGDCKLNSEMISEVQELIEEMQNREYHPRVLTELFEKGGAN